VSVLLGRQIGEVIFEDDRAARIYNANVFGHLLFWDRRTGQDVQMDRFKRALN
jgi:hypothetical protein